MLTLATRLKTLAFAVIAVAVISHIGINYAALGRYVGLRGYYVVKVDLPETGGLLTNADVTYRGVSVGRVGPLHLTGDGVRADLRIKNSAPKIPARTRAVVADLSAVGEVYLDLQPETGDGPYLAGGAVIPRSATQTPAPVTDLLTSVNDLAASIPLESLRTVVDELGTAFNGQGQNLQILLDSGGALVRTAHEHSAPTNRLIVDAEAVLRTQNEEAGALVSFARSAKLLDRRLRESDPDLRKLITVAPRASAQVAGLLRDLDPGLSVLLANLLTTSDLLLTRVNGVEELLVKAPRAVAAGSSMAGSGRLALGMVTTFFNPLPCTWGYGGTTYRNGLDTSPGPALNTTARCAMPAASGVNVRGSAHAPRGGLPAPIRAGSVGLDDVATSWLPGALGLPALPPSPVPPAGSPDLSGLLGLPGRS